MLKTQGKSLRELQKKLDTGQQVAGVQLPKVSVRGALDVDQEKLVEVALSNRMETIQLELQLAIDELDVELDRNAILPDLSLRYSYDGQTEGGG